MCDEKEREERETEREIEQKGERQRERERDRETEREREIEQRVTHITHTHTSHTHTHRTHTHIAHTHTLTMNGCSYFPFSRTKAPVIIEAKNPAPVANSCVNAITEPAYLAAISRTLTATPAMNGALNAYLCSCVCVCYYI